MQRKDITNIHLQLFQTSIHRSIHTRKPLEHSLRPYSHLDLRTTFLCDQTFSKKDARQLRKGGIFWKRASGRTHLTLLDRCNVGTFAIKPVTVRQAEAVDL